MSIKIILSPESITTISLSKSQYRDFRCRCLLVPCRSSSNLPIPAVLSSISSSRTTKGGALRSKNFYSWGSSFIRTRPPPPPPPPKRLIIRATREQDTESNATDTSDGNSQNTATSLPPPSSHPQNSRTSSSRSPRRERKWWKGARWQWQPLIQAQELGALLLQLGIVMVAMRMLRPGIPLPGSEPRTPTTYISVPFSDFLSKINNDEVKKVEVDGVHIIFRLRSEPVMVEKSVEGDEGEILIRSGAPTKRVVYKTTRPGDIKTPYEKMLENEVEFGSPDKRSGGFFNSALASTGSRHPIRPKTVSIDTK